MTAVRYLVAKYVPDLSRMEPRNIGVIVWSEGEVAARFAGEAPEQPGEVDGRSVPGFVTSRPAYKQWVRFWRKELDKPAIRRIGGSELVARSSPDYLMVLASTSRGNFHLIEAGMLLDPVDSGELPEVADYLFNALVEEAPAAEEPRDPRLEDVCRRLIDETHVGSLNYFRRNYPLTCPAFGPAEETFEFSYAYGNGRPLRLYQQLPLPGRRNRKILKRNVHHVAWMFEKVLAAKVITHEQGGILVYPTDEQVNDGEVNRAFQMLGAMTRVLNLQEYDKVRDEFQKLPNLIVEHGGD